MRKNKRLEFLSTRPFPALPVASFQVDFSAFIIAICFGFEIIGWQHDTHFL
jgi:hypothetical protein